MNSFDQHRRTATVDERIVDDLLADVRLRFYATQPAALFRRDRRRLVHALTWPAIWLERRGLLCSSQRYRAYFPTYLLKCLQDFFDRHGDELYVEFKHIRNALDVLCGSLRFAEKASAQSRQIEALAAAHRFLRAAQPGPSEPDPAQLPLF